MKKQNKSILAAILALLFLAAALPAYAYEDAKVNEVTADAGKYIAETVKKPQIGSTGGEWAVIGLARSGFAVPQNYFEDYYKGLEEYVKNCQGVLHERKYTEYSRVIVALSAIGRDPANVGGYNLLAPLGDFDNTVWQGLNGSIWALIALDSGNYEMPQNPAAKTQASREMYLQAVLEAQLADGGWALGGKTATASDVDMTGMALQVLSNYQDKAEVKAATDKALSWLSAAQDAEGGFSSWGGGQLRERGAGDCGPDRFGDSAGRQPLCQGGPQPAGQPAELLHAGAGLFARAERRR